MRKLAIKALRQAYRRELIPARARWWLAAQGMRDWYRIIGRELRPHLGDDARAVVIELAAHTFERRYAHLCEQRPELPDKRDHPRALALVMAALYRLEFEPRARWILDGVGGAPKNLRERFEAQRLVASMSGTDRWEEITVHLGEWLITLTEELPARLPRAPQIVAKICFRMGARFAEHTRRTYGLPSDDNAPQHAIEVLRMSEYIFRVNPEHEDGADPEARTGWIEGNACPWFDRPGWQQMHCGIFGQFQSGISSVFDLKYKLSCTIPRHGGATCRIDLKPLRVKPAAKTHLPS